MTTELLLRYVHFVSIFTIAATLVSEHLLLRPAMSRRDIARIATIDAIYGLAALTLLGAGLTLWLGGFGKPAAFYTGNWIFHTKIGLFVLIGLLSIYPTIFFLKNRKGNQDEVINVPKSIIWMLRAEILLLFIIPFLAGLMSKGIGLA